MKLLKITIAFLLLVSLQIYAAQWLHVPPPVEARMSVSVVGGGVPVAASFTCSGDGNEVCDNFDGGSATCGDDALSQANCWESWTATGSGTATITNAAAGLEGTYGKNITVTGDSGWKGTKVSFTSVDNVYAFAMVKIGTLSTNGTTDMACPIVLGASDYCNFAIGAESGVLKFGVWNYSALTTAESPVPTADTLYYVWLEYNRFQENTGCRVYVSTTSVKPSVTAQATASAASIVKIDLRSNKYATLTANNITFDKVPLSTTAAFGNNGE